MNLRVKLAAAASIVLASAAAATGAHASAGPAAQSWLTATCGALSGLQHHSAAAANGRGSLTALLATSATDGKALLAATRRGPAGIPHGGGIAATLHGEAAAFFGYVTARRTAAGSRRAVALALAARTTALGATFVQLARQYPSAELHSAIDQSPACALVHG